LKPLCKQMQTSSGRFIGLLLSVRRTDAVTTTELNYGEDSTGKRVLRFTMVFIYSDQFFARSSGNAMIIQPDKQNATDSFKRVPDSLFGDRARNESGGNQ
jgi:hypothetical protein